jgi:hypothetical protein
MKKFAVLPLVAVAFAAACAESSPTAVVLEDAALSASGNEVNGPTWVLGSFSLTPQSIAPGLNMHPGGKGTCRNAAGQSGSTAQHTVWYNEQGRRTSSKFCEGTANGGANGSPVSCSITGIPATYAAKAATAGAGNENLNFFSEAEGDEVLDHFVHFKGNHSKTVGKGTVNFEFTCSDGIGGQGSFALDTQFSVDPGNLFKDGPVAGSRALETAGTEVFTSRGPAPLSALYWIYRSRVGS